MGKAERLVEDQEAYEALPLTQKKLVRFVTEMVWLYGGPGYVLERGA